MTIQLLSLGADVHLRNKSGRSGIQISSNRFNYWRLECICHPCF